MSARTQLATVRAVNATVPDAAILARWPGRCPYCVRPIKRGDLIVKVAGSWLHDDCEAVAPEESKR